MTRPTFSFVLWRGDTRVGDVRFARDVWVEHGMAVALIDVDAGVTDLRSVTQVAMGDDVFEQDKEPRIPRRRGEPAKNGGNFALLPADRSVSPELQFSLRTVEGDRVACQWLTVTEIILPEGWEDDRVDDYSRSNFVDGRAWELTFIAGPPIRVR